MVVETQTISVVFYRYYLVDSTDTVWWWFFFSFKASFLSNLLYLKSEYSLSTRGEIGKKSISVI